MTRRLDEAPPDLRRWGLAVSTSPVPASRTLAARRLDQTRADLSAALGLDSTPAE